jgi:hypothetical protein
MTRRERAQVVELLKCAVDERPASDGFAAGVVGKVDEKYCAELLEAVARVELGEWP